MDDRLKGSEIYEEIKLQNLLNFPDYLKELSLFTHAGLKGIGIILTLENQIFGF